MDGVNILRIVVALLILIANLALWGGRRVVVVMVVDCGHGEVEVQQQSRCLSMSFEAEVWGEGGGGGTFRRKPRREG